MRTILTLIITTAFLSAQDAPTPPEIPVSMSAEFWAAAARFKAIEQEYLKAKETLEARQSELAKQCGPDHTWNVAVAGKPTCDPKPKK